METTIKTLEVAGKIFELGGCSISMFSCKRVQEWLAGTLGPQPVDRWFIP